MIVHPVTLFAAPGDTLHVDGYGFALGAGR